MDIVDTLRERYRLDPTVQQAADEIERLRKRVEVLEMDYGHSVKEGIDLAKGWKDAVAEANQLREALREINSEWGAEYGMHGLRQTILHALGEKE